MKTTFIFLFVLCLAWSASPVVLEQPPQKNPAFLEQPNDTLQTRIDELKKERARLLQSTKPENSIIRNLDAHIAQLEAQLKERMQGIPSSQTLVIDSLQTYMDDLKKERMRLLQSADSDHPVIRNLDAEIARLQNQVDNR